MTPPGSFSPSDYSTTRNRTIRNWDDYLDVLVQIHYRFAPGQHEEAAELELRVSNNIEERLHPQLPQNLTPSLAPFEDSASLITSQLDHEGPPFEQPGNGTRKSPPRSATAGASIKRTIQLIEQVLNIMAEEKNNKTC